MAAQQLPNYIFSHILNVILVLMVKDPICNLIFERPEPSPAYDRQGLVMGKLRYKRSTDVVSGACLEPSPQKWYCEDMSFQDIQKWISGKDPNTINNKYFELRLRNLTIDNSLGDTVYLLEKICQNVKSLEIMNTNIQTLKPLVLFGCLYRYENANPPDLPLVSVYKNELVKSIRMYYLNSTPPVPSITNVTIWNAQINKIECYQFQHFDSLKRLSLRYNNIEVIEDMIFTSFKSLEYLDLISNRIVSLNIMAFAKMAALVELKLSHNLIHSVYHFPFYGTFGLKYLYLDNNFINSLDLSDFARLPNLKELHLNNNSIVRLGNNVPLFWETIEVFLLHDNKLDTIPGILNAPHLRIFNLSNNNLKVLTYPFNLPSTVNYLGLKNNSLICDASTYLLSLWIKKWHKMNHTDEIEDNRDELTKLTCLAYTKPNGPQKLIALNQINESLYQLQLSRGEDPWCKTLWRESNCRYRKQYIECFDVNPSCAKKVISNNVKAANFSHYIFDHLIHYPLDIYPNIKALLEHIVRYKVISITISNSQLCNLSETYLAPPLKNLTKLIFKANCINTIPKGFFSNFTNLRYIDLSYNSFTILQPHYWEALSLTLEYLMLENNFISVIEEYAMTSLKKLTTLSLRNNLIKVLPDNSFSPLLKFLYLEKNMISTIPMYLAARDLDQLTFAYNDMVCSCSHVYVMNLKRKYGPEADRELIDSSYDQMFCYKLSAESIFRNLSHTWSNETTRMDQFYQYNHVLFFRNDGPGITDDTECAWHDVDNMYKFGEYFFRKYYLKVKCLSKPWFKAASTECDAINDALVKNFDNYKNGNKKESEDTDLTTPEVDNVSGPQTVAQQSRWLKWRRDHPVLFLGLIIFILLFVLCLSLLLTTFVLHCYRGAASIKKLSSTKGSTSLTADPSRNPNNCQPGDECYESDDDGDSYEYYYEDYDTYTSGSSNKNQDATTVAGLSSSGSGSRSSKTDGTMANPITPGTVGYIAAPSEGYHSSQQGSSGSGGHKGQRKKRRRRPKKTESVGSGAMNQKIDYKMYSRAPTEKDTAVGKDIGENIVPSPTGLNNQNLDSVIYFKERFDYTDFMN